MRRVAMRLASLMVLGLLAASAARAVEIDSKAEKITLTGRVQPLWTYSSFEDGNPSNEFLLRRARLAMKVKINDWISGVVEPDFGEGKLALKDAYFAFEPVEDRLEFIVGQTKRRYDLFELTSSTQILVIERDGRIGRLKVPSLSFLTEELGYADRDIGLFVLGNTASERVRIEAAVTNGAGANTKPTIGEKAFQGRVSVEPIASRPLTVNGGVSLRPYESTFDRVTGVDTVSVTNVEYGTAFEGSIEYGKWERGPHVQAGVVGGTNFDSDIGGVAKTDNRDAASFLALQGIVTYKKAFANPTWFEAVEPLVRVSWADPNTDVDNDGGIVITPGVNLFVTGRTRMMANVDVFVPEANDNPSTTATDESETLFGVKVASWLYF